MHTKPFYFEDLEDAEAIDENLKLHFQAIFLRVMNVVLAFIIGGLADYGIYRFHESSLGWFEILGLVGGLLSLYRTVWDHIGRFILMYLLIKKHRRRGTILNTPYRSNESPALRPYNQYTEDGGSTPNSVYGNRSVNHIV
jgi:hypothetical protein